MRKFEFEIPTFNTTVAAQFLARKNSGQLLMDQLLGPPSATTGSAHKHGFTASTAIAGVIPRG